MSTKQRIPEGYHAIQPYLFVRSAAEAIRFYEKAFDAKPRFQMPGPDGRIMHAELQFGDSVIMLADEAPERGIHSPLHYKGAPMSLHFYVEDCDRVYHQALAAGAKSLREPTDQFYGDRAAGVEDPFGFQWYLATHIRDVSAEEMKAAMDRMKGSQPA